MAVYIHSTRYIVDTIKFRMNAIMPAISTASPRTAVRAGQLDAYFCTATGAIVVGNRGYDGQISVIRWSCQGEKGGPKVGPKEGSRVDYVSFRRKKQHIPIGQLVQMIA